MKVAVLGNGQLGAMLQQAGQRIGIEVSLLNPDADQLPSDDVPITVEREHWPHNPFTTALEQHPAWLNSRALAVLANRLSQKRMLDELCIATAPWCELRLDMSQADLHQRLGPDIFLKRTSGGYDGRGQMRLRDGTPSQFAEWADKAIAEQAIAFDTEVSIIGARGRDGQCVFYRLTENRHHHGVLELSLSCPQHFAHLQAQAEQMLRKVMESFDYVGVMAIECFVLGDKLLVNEIAPRVHNSGHWTQAGASISQFELHLRAVCNLPLPQPEQFGFTIMFNLLGQHYNPAWLEHGAAQLHWYGKSWREGRKMGHLNLHHHDPRKLAEWLQTLAIAPELNESRDWALLRLNTLAK